MENEETIFIFNLLVLALPGILLFFLAHNTSYFLNKLNFA